MLGTLFMVPVFQYKIEDWDNKKEKILKLVDFEKLTRRDEQPFYSDRQTANYTDELIDIISPELQEFIKELGASQIDINTSWTVNYKKGDFHPPHAHSATGYSGIILLNFDEQEHTPTMFVDPVVNSVTDTTEISCPKGEEGKMIIVPSNILHFTYPNNSDKDRTIVSFDISVIP